MGGSVVACIPGHIHEVDVVRNRLVVVRDQLPRHHACIALSRVDGAGGDMGCVSRVSERCVARAWGRDL